jgi:nitrite transporter NirC
VYQTVIDQFADSAAAKARAMRDNPLGFFIACMMAGAYIGRAIILIFSLGPLAEPAARPLVMGVSFGIALTLIVFAGAELFTGHTMVMTLGLLTGRTGLADLGKSWALTWTGNLIGSEIAAWIFWLGGGGQILKDGASFIFDAAAGKMHAAPLTLFARGILCNWLVCLGLWMAGRSKDDTAKLIVLFWALFAFIASGYEHSVANMTVFALSLIGNHPDTVSLAGAAYNLFWVTLGNIVAGAIFMGLGYVLANGRRVVAAAPAAVAQAAE